MGASDRWCGLHSPTIAETVRTKTVRAMSTAHYRSTDLADRIEALLAEPNQPRNDALKFRFEVIEPAPVPEDADAAH